MPNLAAPRPLVDELFQLSEHAAAGGGVRGGQVEGFRQPQAVYGAADKGGHVRGNAIMVKPALPRGIALVQAF